MRKEIMGILLVLALISVSTEVISTEALIQKSTKTLQEYLSTQVQRFRLLAVEGVAGELVRLRDAQYLIEELLHYPNWNNSTEQSKSYMRFLSNYVKDEVIDIAKPFWIGNSTKDNVRSQIIDFLGQASPDETVVFYCGTNGLQLQIYLGKAPNYEVINSTELISWLSGVQAKTICILDVCYAGSWIDDGIGGVLGDSRIVLASSKSDELSLASPGEFGDFTGQREVKYYNGTMLPLGIIGGLVAAEDLNKDGWISFMEDFAFANASVLQFDMGLQNPVSFNGLGFDPLFVLKPPIANFTYYPNISWPNESTTFNASNSNGSIATYTWDFGDGNITSVTNHTIEHSYINVGNYTVTLNVTDVYSQWNTTAKIITVTYRSDLNKDRTVNILDISIVAAAYNTRPGDEKWNALADLDKNEWINILDISMVAKDFNKTT